MTNLIFVLFYFYGYRYRFGRFAVCCLVSLVLPVLEPVWERVGVRVVDQGVVAVTPGELLGPGEHTNVCHVSR